MAGNGIGLGLIGCGTVGSGVIKLLNDEADLYARRLGRPIELRRVLRRSTRKDDITAALPEGTVTTDPETFFTTDDMPIVIELAGGTDAAGDYVRRAVGMGKHVVTANKALLSAQGMELFALARQHDVAIAFEASCAGGIPVITAMQHHLTANRITAMYGILNGTCNYILTRMTGAGLAYNEALAEAQEAGYAEADPTLDVNGGDTMHKLVILASLAFGAQVTEDHVQPTGIVSLDLNDIRFGEELGYRIKLLAIAEQSDAGLALSVAPCFLNKDEPLAQVTGSFNALSVFGHAVGHTMYYGRGAGQMPTASAVMGDVLNLAGGAYSTLFKQMVLWPDQQSAPRLVAAADARCRYYMRINAMERPGVVAAFSKVLGDQNISIAAVSQHEYVKGQFVPVVVVTHEARVGDVHEAAMRIADLDVIAGEPVSIRIVDPPAG